MKSNSNDFVERKVLDELHSDCKNWRKVASQCARANSRISVSTEELYKVVHGRILARCRNLADEELVPPSHRHTALQMDELLRPWSSAQSLKEAPPSIVHNLVKSQTILDERLAGKDRRIIFGQIGKLALTACAAAICGILIFVFLQWTSGISTSQIRPVEGILTTITAYLGRTSFTERFAVAILVSWLFGTWLLSRLPTS